jgi:O-antigen/teichoic acid export membrane protein
LIPLVLTALLISINSEASIIMLGALARPEDVGVFTAASRLAALVSYALLSMNTALGPVIAELWAQRELAKLRSVLKHSARQVLWFTFPLAAGLIIGAPWLLDLFGPDFVRGDTSVQVLAIAHLISALAGPCGLVLLMTGHEREAAWGVLASALVGLVGNALLIPHLGVLGAAIASATGTIVWNLLLLGLVLQRVRVQPTAFF